MGGKGKRRHQSNQHGGSAGGGKKQKQSVNKGKEDGDGSAIVLSRSKKTSSGSISLPVPGLMNLGNTCFFNSVMQNLAQTHYLRQKMKEIIAKEKISVVLPSPKESLPSLSLCVDSKPGKFAQDFHDFIEEMRNKPKQPLNPRLIFSHVCKNAPRFSSYQQQDSQELLRYLLDALRNEEVYRIKKAILEYYNVKSRSKDTTSALSDNEKKDIKTYGLQALQHQTYVEDVFGGKILSCITCKECKKRCEMEEGFLDLSLPVPSELAKPGFSSRSSLKNKKRVVRHSSEDAEGDDEGEGLHYGHQKVKNKEDPVKFSKHQLKQKRKEERKRSKGNKKFTLEQFQKEEAINLIDSRRNGSIENGEISIDSPSPMAMSRSVSMDTHDSCLADDEVTLLSTQQDSDSGSALCMNVGDVNDMDTQQVSQNFTQSLSSSEDKTDEGQKDPPTTPKDPQPEDSLSAKTQEMKLEDSGGCHGNQNLSESLVAMYEAGKDTNQNTPLHSPADKVMVTVDSSKSFNDEVPNAGTDWVPNFTSRTSTVSVTDVADTLQNIGEEGVTDTINKQGEEPEEVALETKNKEEKPAGEEVKHEADTTGNSCHHGDNIKKKPPVKEEDKRSLENCLKEFTSEELLSGSDRFYCHSCSLQSSPERRTTLRPHPPAADSAQSATNTQITTTNTDNTDSGTSASVSEGYDKGTEEQLTALVERDEVSSPERSLSSVSSSTSCKEEDEDTEMLESTKESDDNMDNVSQCSSSVGNERIVLRDAIKQMLITKPPPVLCLHLKRFIQHGKNFKNMRKNSSFVPFPFILDIAPFCTANCKISSGADDGQILYSLYGVVVHGGGMHGGHYTAFVRIRNELNIKDIIAGDGSSNTKSAEPSTAETNQQQSIDQAHSETSVNNNSQVATEINLVASETNEATKLPTTSTKEPSASTSDISTSSATPFAVEYDLSSTEGGSWYHISDSHVKKSSEAEVSRAEAYILFYERLPCSVKH